MCSNFCHVLNLLIISCLLFAISCKEKSEPDVENTPPQITIHGDNPLKTGIFLSFVDEKVNVYDYYGLNGFYETSTVDTSQLGKHSITYHAVGMSGLTAEATRDVWVVVKPESMKTEWNVTIYNAKKAAFVTFLDSLTIFENTLYINNLNDIEGAKVALALTSDLQDSVYIKEQILIDSTRIVRGNGIIDKKAMLMQLKYQIIENKVDTSDYSAIYNRNHQN